MVIDFHAHIYPDKVAGRAVDSVAKFYSITVQGAGTVEDLLACGRRGGVDRFVVLPVAGVPAQVESINNFTAEVCRVNPQLAGFGTLHKDMEHPEDEIARILSLGLRGIKLHPDMQLFYIDDEGMYEIYDMLQGRLPLLLHCGDYRYEYSHPARLAKVLDLFPKLTVIAAHFGGWSLFDLAREYLGKRSCYLDVSSSIMFLGLRRAAELIRLYGAERILFGSDYPMWDPGEEKRRVDAMGLSDRELALIYEKNALHILEMAGSVV
ncbi:MAG: amidohydrolase [Oscillospiraceae bacterium]|jgi:predicted TIM-barrel fold metal-dependent hydrolase|nr:amidohydrolase [Oscillospiraceae bacterium]